jgi:uncharacterized coiled-coil protein SlyX
MKRTEENRKAKRKPFDKRDPAFLGSSPESDVYFEYVLLDLSRTGVRIGVSPSGSTVAKVKKGHTVRFHLPFEVENYFYDQGSVIWAGFDEGSQRRVYGISVRSQTPLPFPLGGVLKGDLFSKSVKDLADLKGSILVYLTHLRPHFGGNGGITEERRPKSVGKVLKRLEEKVARQKERLEELSARLDRTDRKRMNLRKTRVNRIKVLTESDVSRQVLAVLSGTTGIDHYLEPIRGLEQRLYATYNLIVMLYFSTL